MISAIINAKIFDSEKIHADTAVILNDYGQVADMVPQHDLSDSVSISRDLNQDYLVPGFIDLHASTATDGKLSIETIRASGLAHQSFGTTNFLPTVRCDNFQYLKSGIASVQKAIVEGVPGILGIHLEGEFLRCFFEEALGCDIKYSVLKKFVSAITSTLTSERIVVSVEPEFFELNFVEKYEDFGVVFCVDQPNITMDQFPDPMNAIESESSVGQQTRFADSDDCQLNALSLSSRSLISTIQSNEIPLWRDTLYARDWSENTIDLDFQTIYPRSGSIRKRPGRPVCNCSSMQQMVSKTIRSAAVDWQEVVRMASLYPAQALGVDHGLGKIAPGYRANFTALNANFEVTGTWVDGRIEN